MVDYLDVYVARAEAARARQLTGTTSPFTITVRFTGGLTRSQQDAFVAAADRWTRVIVGDLPTVELDGEIIEHVIVLASAEDIDGEGNILGRAGPTHIRAGGAPCRGEMLFDSSDLTVMERNGEMKVDGSDVSRLIPGDVWSIELGSQEVRSR